MLLCGCVYEHAHLSVSRLVYEHRSTSRAAVYTLSCAGGCAGWDLHSLAVQSLGPALTRPWFEFWRCNLVVVLSASCSRHKPRGNQLTVLQLTHGRRHCGAEGGLRVARTVQLAVTLSFQINKNHFQYKCAYATC